ncbi:MAG TPA: hypothetical protein VF432_07895 [Thermoanaerobaculia bacterium]
MSRSTAALIGPAVIAIIRHPALAWDGRISARQLARGSYLVAARDVREQPFVAIQHDSFGDDEVVIIGAQEVDGNVAATGGVYVIDALIVCSTARVRWAISGG